MNNIISKKYMDNSYIIELNEKEINILTNIASKIKSNPSKTPNLFCENDKDVIKTITKVKIFLIIIRY